MADADKRHEHGDYVRCQEEQRGRQECETPGPRT